MQTRLKNHANICRSVFVFNEEEDDKATDLVKTANKQERDITMNNILMWSCVKVECKFLNPISKRRTTNRCASIDRQKPA